MSSRACRPPQLRQGGGWRNVPRPASTEDGQGRGCAQRSTETDAKSSPGERSFSSCLRKSPAGCGQGRYHPRPQERVQRHIVEHLTDVMRVAPMVQILDAPVPQMVDNETDGFRVMDRPIAEQVIAVPKIVASSCPSRVEHLVEVPTVVSLSSMQQLTAEQNVDIPVPRTRGDHRGFHGSLPGSGSSQRTVEQLVDFPFGGGLRGFPC